MHMLVLDMYAITEVYSYIFQTCLMNATHTEVFRAITANTTTDDAEINKMTRNLVEVCLTDIGVRPEFNENIPAARKELSQLNRFSTPLGRLFCFKRAISNLSRPLKNSSGKDGMDHFHLIYVMFLFLKSSISCRLYGDLTMKC